MQSRNQSTVTDFLILGFSDLPNLQMLIFVVFLSIYLITLTGNIIILTLTCIDSRLHKPMYFFLCNLAILDISYTSDTLPKMLVITLTANKAISFQACMTQLYLIMSFTGVEFYLLTAMAYDRFVAICNPFRYSVIMNKRVCALLATSSWIGGFLDALPHIVLTARATFCGNNKLNHFFCDLQTLLKLSCSDVSIIQILMTSLNLCLVMGCFLLTLTSYVYIISAILKINSKEGRRKTFSTCSSHFTIVVIYYVTVLSVYMRPVNMNTMPGEKLFGALYNAVIPMLNPIIYSLRNKDVKDALRKCARRRVVD
uniref:Olfactory receptor n=1 Tax=Geotrypetes seraphini TaxID=260995 RepID=A0A6P8PGS8_GEOSA|nr:olfactory receptor 5V1-like [Geotrypetes seraphini]